MPVYPTLSLAEFLPYVLPKALGCAEPYAMFCLRRAAIDFCERTKCWRHTMTVAVAANNKTLVDPTNATIHEFRDVWFDGRKLTPVAFEEAEPAELSGQTVTAAPEYVTQPNPGVVSIYPFQAGTLRLSVILKPRHGQAFGGDASDPLADALDVVPPFMLQHHAEALACGALARILATPAQKYTDLALAGEYAQEFAAKARAAASDLLTGQQRAPLRTKSQWM